MTVNPLVSLIVPIYGVEPYIARCARSVLGQTYPEIQFIFVDDGTPDRSVEFLEGIIDGEYPQLRGRIRIIHKPNGGLPQARQSGLSQADGEYILFVDADDWAEPDLVERLVRKAAETGSDLVYCDYFKEYEGRTSRGREAEYRTLVPLLTDLVAGHSMHGYLWDKMFRRSLLRDEYCVPLVNMREDLVLTFQLFFRARGWAHVAAPLYHYRRDNAGSISHVDKRTQTRMCAINQILLMEFYRQHPDPGPDPTATVRDALLFVTLEFIRKTDSWDLMDAHPWLWREARTLRLPGRYWNRVPRYLRLRAAIRRRGKATGRF